MAEPSDWSANPFWDFSVALYRRPGVAEACIALQEKLGIDVNLLLYVIWAARTGGALSHADVASAVERVSRWHDSVVRPLRALRTELKSDSKGAPTAAAERLRNQIKSAELNAERVEQEMLYADRRAGGGKDGGVAAARANSAAYFEVLKIAAESADWRNVDVILESTES